MRVRIMFDSLSDKLSLALKKLRGQAILTESNISEAMDDIKLALLSADVNYDIAKEFVESVRSECLGSEVLKSVTPGQQVIKIVNDKLVELMGEKESGFDLDAKPAVIMMVGLHGSGKTTTSAKLAAYFKKNNKSVMLVAGDIYRPAAIDQLEILGKEVGVDVYTNRNQVRVDIIAKEAKSIAKEQGIDVVIIDTAGRFQIDEDMVQELISVSQSVMPKEILLVADSALGQEAVSVSGAFHKALGLTGVILTKLDGDARGGAALSIKKTTSCPIKMVGVGEKISDFEVFYPDRIASRILGMGDVVSLVEQAKELIDVEESERMAKKLKANQLDLNDFLDNIRQMKKLGGIEKIMGMLPGGKSMIGKIKNSDLSKFSAIEAMICSMTKKERENPEIIDPSRKKRIANGSGTKIEDLNDLISQFSMMKKVMKKPSILGAMSGRFGGGMPSMPSLSGAMGGFQRGSNRIKPKDRKKKKKR